MECKPAPPSITHSHHRYLWDYVCVTSIKIAWCDRTGERVRQVCVCICQKLDGIFDLTLCLNFMMTFRSSSFHQNTQMSPCSKTYQCLWLCSEAQLKQHLGAGPPHPALPGFIVCDVISDIIGWNHVEGVTVFVWMLKVDVRSDRVHESLRVLEYDYRHYELCYFSICNSHMSDGACSLNSADLLFIQVQRSFLLTFQHKRADAIGLSVTVRPSASDQWKNPCSHNTKSLNTHFYCSFRTSTVVAHPFCFLLLYCLIAGPAVPQSPPASAPSRRPVTQRPTAPSASSFLTIRPHSRCASSPLHTGPGHTHNTQPSSAPFSPLSPPSVP